MAEDWTATKQENGHWVFTWDGDSVDGYDIWLNGVLLDTVTGLEYECKVSGYDETPPPLEIVLDESTTYAENELYPPYAIIQWRGVTSAFAYMVERYVDGEWLDRKLIMEDGSGWYFHRTPAMDDDTEEQWRVSALDSRNNAGDPLAFTFTVVRNPSEPSVSLSVDSDGDITVGSG